MTSRNGSPSPDNRRGFTRVHSQVEAALLHHRSRAVVATGQVRDISMNGICLACGAELEEGASHWLRIPLQPGVPAPVITVATTVVRCDDAGLALRFDEISLESYELLRNLVLYNASVVVQVEQELAQKRGIQPQVNPRFDSVGESSDGQGIPAR